MATELNWIRVRNANLHCLKGVNVDLPIGKISAIAGPSGSGKSSLALGVIHAECKRRYLETIHTIDPRNTQFSRNIPVDSIEGLRPSLALGPLPEAPEIRYTVGISTECDSLLRPIWARLAYLHCPHCQEPLEVLAPQQMVDRIANLNVGARVQLHSSIAIQGQTLEQLATTWIQQGFTRAWVNQKAVDLSQLTSQEQKEIPTDFSILVDRWVIKDGLRSRIADSLQIALRIGYGAVWLQVDSNTNIALADHPRCPHHGDLLPKLDATLYSPFSQIGKDPTLDGNFLIPLLETSHITNITWAQIQDTPIQQVPDILNTIQNHIPSQFKRSIAQVIERIAIMQQLGLGHITLRRSLQHLSDGERQRLRIVSMASGHLDGLLLILDEIGSGLDANDCERIWNILTLIRDRGNTILLVEHNPHMLKRAEYIIEMGPGAGENGGQVLLQGFNHDVLLNEASTTRQWLAALDLPTNVSQKKCNTLTLNIPQNSLLPKTQWQIAFPGFTLIHGPSGSGKSTLLHALKEAIHAQSQSLQIEVQASGASSLRAAKRSTIATASGIMNHLRDLYSSMPEAKIRGLGQKNFSMNIKGGRCEACLGMGKVMDPLSFDEYPCHVCQGKRFRDEVLAIRFKSLHISDLLDLSVEQLLPIFDAFPRIKSKLLRLKQTGLGYLSLGLSTETLSGGELQRAGLALDLASTTQSKTIYFLDTPSRGLHYQDTTRLVALIQELVQQGHAVVMADQSQEFLRACDISLNTTFLP